MASNEVKYEEIVSVKNTAKKFQVPGLQNTLSSNNRKLSRLQQQESVDKILKFEENNPKVKPTPRNQSSNTQGNSSVADSSEEDESEPEIQQIGVRDLMQKFSNERTTTKLNAKPNTEFNIQATEPKSTPLGKSNIPSVQVEPSAIKKPVEARIKPMMSRTSIVATNVDGIPNFKVSLNATSELKHSEINLEPNQTLNTETILDAETKNFENKELEDVPTTNNDQIDQTPIATVKETKPIFSNGSFLEKRIIPEPKPRVKIQNTPLDAETSLQTSTIHVPPETVHNWFEEKQNTILLLGLRQSGKSSLINHLLQQDLCIVHNSVQQNPHIYEINATIEEFGSIILIDTPGFTNNFQEDVSLCTTISSYFQRPKAQAQLGLILVLLNYETHFQNYDDLGLVSNFLQTISHYQANQFDSKTQIQFVMTHTKGFSRWEMEQVSLKFGDLVRAYISKNINTALAFHSKNGKGHAQDLFQTMRRQKENSIWCSTFGHSNYPKTLLSSFVSSTIPLTSSSSPWISKLVQDIYTSGNAKEKTEISGLLEIGWENVDANLRSTYPLALCSLQEFLASNGISTFADLPQEPLQMLELLNSLPSHDPATADLFTETLQVKIPFCYASEYIGQGYAVNKDKVTRISPFQNSGLYKTSPVGLLPEEIACKITDDREIMFRFYDAFEEYVLDRFQDLGLPHAKFPNTSKSGVPKLLGNLRSGYNLINPNDIKTTPSANANIEYRLFQLSLTSQPNVEFQPKFWSNLTSLPDLDVKNESTVEAWDKFFSYWGTHIVKSAYAGGSIEVSLRGKVLSKIWKGMKDKQFDTVDAYETTKILQWITGDGLDMDEEVLQGYDIDSKFIGGNARFQQQDLTKLSESAAAKTRNDWIQTLPLAPVILESNLGLVPLSYFVRLQSEELATKMDTVFLHFYAGFVISKASGCVIL